MSNNNCESPLQTKKDFAENYYTVNTKFDNMSLQDNIQDNIIAHNQNIDSSQQIQSNYNNIGSNNTYDVGSECQDSTQGSPIQIRIQQNQDNQKQNQYDNCSCGHNIESQDDEIKEDESHCKSTNLFPPSQNNSNNNIPGEYTTNDNLSRQAQFSAQNLSKQDLYQDDYLKEPQNIAYNISQKSCNHIDDYNNDKKAKRSQLTLKIQGNKEITNNDKDLNSPQPTPSRIIQKRVSMVPQQNQNNKINCIENPISLGGRRKSLPEFNEFQYEKEPEYNYEDPDHMYKIYCGDAIDEGSQQNDGLLEDGFEEDGFMEDGIEEDQVKDAKKKLKKNPINYLKQKPKFQSDDFDDEDPADTPIKKFSKFEEDRIIVQKSKMENGGITPQKYLVNKSKFSFK